MFRCRSLDFYVVNIQISIIYPNMNFKLTNYATINKFNVMLVYLFDELPFKVSQSFFGMKLANQNLINTLLAGPTTMS